MATTTSPGTTTAPAVGTTTTQGLSDWAAPYITNYLGKAQALGEMNYEPYKGPLTAGASDIQKNLFSGIGGLSLPQNYGKSFTDQGVAQSYMNPYLQQALDPQLQELQRQSQINLQPSLAKLTQAGGFGGGRQAIMESEAARNLLQEQNKTVGSAYADAYNKAMQQFNAEQGQGQSLAELMGKAGAEQRGIEKEAVQANLDEFNRQKQFPYQQVMFMRDMLSGLPTSSVSSQQNAPQGIAALAQAAGGLDELLKLAGSNAGLAGLLKNLGFDT
jgi:hypothetical protein